MTEAVRSSETSVYSETTLRYIQFFITLMMEAVRTSEKSVYCTETTQRYIPFLITVMMEAVGISETSSYSNETIRRYISEGFKLHTRENLKSHILHCWLSEIGLLSFTRKEHSGPLKTLCGCCSISGSVGCLMTVCASHLARVAFQVTWSYSHYLPL
jgi:hypothetical protein